MLPQLSRATLKTVIYQAAAALTHADPDRALDGLRSQLQVMSVAAGATPDWSTLTLAGPTQTGTARDGSLFEWTASITVHGVTVFDLNPDPDFLPPAGRTDDMTMPLPASEW